MTSIATQVEPSDVGLSAMRLERIATHFDGYVDDGRLAGWLCAVARRGSVAWVGSGGDRDVERHRPVDPDTIWRIYSMTKPVTSIAAMLLHEEGRFDLNDEVSTWLPEFSSAQVYVDGPAEHPTVRPASAPILVWHLLTHTAGLTYGFQRNHPVDAIYRMNGHDFGPARGADLEGAVRTFASLPLRFDPGSAWNYSVATDVVGRLIELWANMPLDEFLQTRIFGPLGMVDTGFFCPPESQDRLAELYVYSPGPSFRSAGTLATAATRRPTMFSGGGGLVSTAHDYHRFASMLLAGGQLDGVRIVAPSTIALTSRNYLPGGADLHEFAVDGFSEVTMAGMGFGLGLACVIDRAALKLPTSEGSITWGGAASTTFWVDPHEELSCVFFTQLIPSTTYRIRRELQRLTYQAIVD
jgi:CubicO group peptidase (beta-lactamase class C family)